MLCSSFVDRGRPWLHLSLSLRLGSLAGTPSLRALVGFFDEIENRLPRAQMSFAEGAVPGHGQFDPTTVRKLFISEDAVLLFAGTFLGSRAGVQQGDPLGPLLFFPVLALLLQNVETDSACCLDDGAVGGKAKRICPASSAAALRGGHGA
jgi:hypothetical protein